MRVNANLLPNSFGENVYNFIPCNCGILRDQLGAAWGVVEREQTLGDGVRFGFLNRPDAH
jgi:hypothetical protein